jgi:hypothetical protein
VLSPPSGSGNISSFGNLLFFEILEDGQEIFSYDFSLAVNKQASGSVW